MRNDAASATIQSANIRRIAGRRRTGFRRRQRRIGELNASSGGDGDGLSNRSATGKQWRKFVDLARPRTPNPAAFRDEAEDNVLGEMQFTTQRRTKIHSTNPLERLNGEIKRRSQLVGIFQFL